METTITGSAAIQPLPILVRAVDGETPESYFSRLAPANFISHQSLWSHVRSMHGQLSQGRNPARACAELEILGGIPEGWFEDNRRRHLLPIRCTHTLWRHQICLRCSRTPPVRPGCRRCAHGTPTQISSIHGAICLRHSRWTHNGADLDVSLLPRHIAAERRYRAIFPRRGVGLETGELQLAARLLAGTEMPDSASTSDTFFAHYPGIVRLAETLTDPEFVRLLLDPYWTPSQNALLISSAVTEIVGSPLADTSIEVLWDTVYTGRRAVQTAFGMMGTNRTRTVATQRAFSAAAHTHRACLLRHLDAKIERPGWITTPARRAPTAAAAVRFQHPWTS